MACRAGGEVPTEAARTKKARTAAAPPAAEGLPPKDTDAQKPVVFCGGASAPEQRPPAEPPRPGRRLNRATGRYVRVASRMGAGHPLLEKRMRAPLDYTLFGAAGVPKIWKALYAYRSSIAHGGEVDFTGTAAILKSPSRAKRLLNAAVKAVIRAAMTEPDLVLDLRAV